MRALAQLLGAALVAWVMVGPAAAAPRLRDGAQVEGGHIRVGDIWDDAGARRDAVVGPAPPPGQHIIVEGQQLAYIAQMFNVSWRPASPAERIVIERSGRPVPQEAVLDVLRRALAEAGVSGETEIEVPGLETPIMPSKALVQPVVEGFNYDRGTGRFGAVLAFGAVGLPTQRQRIAGRVVVVREVAVTTRRLAAGAVLGPADVQAARLPAAQVPATALRDPLQAIGQAMRHPVGPGEPLIASDLGRPTVIEKGAAVQLSLETAGISLVAIGQALSPGGIGERIRVLNTVSRAIVDAVVTGPGAARVSPESMPVGRPRAGVAARAAH